MHITEILALRAQPAAGVYLALTRRCPLRCEHCSTTSLMNSEEHPEDVFERFVGSFTADDRPELLWLTGGEPLLRPELVSRLTDAAHAVGTRVALVTGLFYARRSGRIPPALLPVLLGVDHVVASLDIYHERQIPRAHALATVRSLVQAGQDVSFQIVGAGPDDPYLAEVTDDLRRTFDDRVPAFVAPLGAVGRARQLIPVASLHRPQMPDPVPCPMAAWPVVTFDGSVVGCCSQEVVDGPGPAHLSLGDTGTATWGQLRRTVLDRPLLRVLRTYGPEYAAAAFDAGPPSGGYCATCRTLTPSDEVAAVVAAPSFTTLEREVLTAQLDSGSGWIAQRYGIGRYAHMLTLGAPDAN